MKQEQSTQHVKEGQNQYFNMYFFSPSCHSCRYEKELLGACHLMPMLWVNFPSPLPRSPWDPPWSVDRPPDDAPHTMHHRGRATWGLQPAGNRDQPGSHTFSRAVMVDRAASWGGCGQQGLRGAESCLEDIEFTVHDEEGAMKSSQHATLIEFSRWHCLHQQSPLTSPRPISQ